MEIKNGTVVLITGGASGIGKLMGKIVLQKGAELVIWDINQARIEETIAEFSSIGKVSGYKVDVSDVDEITAAAVLVRQNHGIINLLINNAGIVFGKYFQIGRAHV